MNMIKEIMKELINSLSDECLLMLEETANEENVVLDGYAKERIKQVREKQQDEEYSSIKDNIIKELEKENYLLNQELTKYKNFVKGIQDFKNSHIES